MPLKALSYARLGALSRRFIAIFVGTLFFSLLANANAAIQTVELQHQTAEALIPLIEPLLEDGETVSGRGSLLIINTGERRYQELLTVIERLDLPPKQLLIEIRAPQRFTNDNRQQQTELIFSTQEGGRIEHRSSSTLTTRDNSNVHSIRVLSGYAAHIESGQIVPLLSESFQFGGRPGFRGAELSYHKVANSISLLPQLHGNSVTLQITPHYSSLDYSNNGAIAVQESATTVTLPLNQWTTLSQADNQQDRRGPNSISTRSVSTTTQVRVTVLDHEPD